MLEACSDDDQQLGVVLSHEIAHVALNHVVRCGKTSNSIMSQNASLFRPRS